MKKTFFMLQLMMAGTITQAQPYIPFPAANVEWTVVHDYYPCDDLPLNTSIYRYQLDGDTILSGTSYHKLTATTGSLAPVFIGGIREDDKKIYYRHVPNTHGFMGPVLSPEKEFLLYDFGANTVGQMVQHDPSDVSLRSEVTGIDWITVGGSSRKRIRVKSPLLHAEEYWVEGVGSTGLGLISSLTTAAHIACESHKRNFVCFKEHGNILYLNPLYQDCEARPGPVAISSVKSSSFRIFPNPAVHNEIRIENIDPHEGIQLKVTDYTGRVLLTQALTQSHTTVKLPQVALSMLVFSDKHGHLLRVEKVIAD